MNEKSYGGNNGIREHMGKVTRDKSKKNLQKINEKNKSKITSDSNQEIDSYIKAGEIAKKIRVFAGNLIKKDMLLSEIAKKIHDKIEELGGEQAFPVNLSIDDIAAHYHPTQEDKTLAAGLLKIDIGVHINGYIADTAFSLDLTDDKKHTKLIEAAESALNEALKLQDNDPTLNDIGKTIQEEIQNKGFSPIVNLCGHSLAQHNIHAGITIPNHANNNENTLPEGSYAIEPFATTGEGKIYEGPPSNIYVIDNYKKPRSPTARKIIDYVYEKYKTLPFSLREIQEKFGPMSRLGMKELVQNNIIHSYPQLIEKEHGIVAQAEHTFIKTKDNIIITTK
ncbi:type II methionyl aminopeptidase [Candidatus Pacearchaeota archaeon]|nr:type II methionyl aminopeptidase [Candidatus Pacearchaeota archaeon]